jgi:hypothetical protein
VRKKCHYANVFCRSAQFRNGVNGLTARVEINDHQLRARLQQAQQRLCSGGHLEFNAQVFGGLRNFHLKKNVIHQRYDATHKARSSGNYYACLFVSRLTDGNWQRV